MRIGTTLPNIQENITPQMKKIASKEDIIQKGISEIQITEEAKKEFEEKATKVNKPEKSFESNKNDLRDHFDRMNSQSFKNRKNLTENDLKE